MKSKVIEWSIVLSVFLLSGCLGGQSNQEEQTQTEESAETENQPDEEDNASDNPFAAMKDAAKQMEKALSEQGLNVEPVDFRDLKALLPEELADLPRTSFEGEKTGSMGIKVSVAEADYRSEDNAQSIDIAISDLGTLSSGMGAMMSAAWLMAEIDKESDSGYEKTTKFEGYRAFEKFNYNSKAAELSLVIANRFVVAINSRGLEMDDLKSATKDLNLDKLEEMKDYGKQKE